MNRHFVRSIIFQTLFECDFRDFKEEKIGEVLNYVIKGFHEISDVPEMLVKEMLDSVTRIYRKKPVIDEIIIKAAPEWPIDKIAAVDRNVLRLGIYELLFADHDKIPQKVAINEAIELAKEFGSDTSSKFINGVIGAVYREIGEPGKEARSRNLKDKKEIKEKTIEYKAGAIIYNTDDDNNIKLCLVHDIFGYWTLIKTTSSDSSNSKDDLKKSIKEKIAIKVEIGDKIADHEYDTHHPEKKDIVRKVEYFLARADLSSPKVISGSGGLDAAKWFPIEEVGELKIYDDVAEIIAKGIQKITN